eukprot:m.48453 g.48453  ORF g.48453 m.48453 type:complete len:382 (+) comp8916_c0_seq1:260-1405(+)
MADAAAPNERPVGPPIPQGQPHMGASSRLSCSGCGAVLSEWTRVQQGKWSVWNNQEAWYLDTMGGITVTRSAPGIWKTLRQSGVVHPNAVAWHNVECAACNKALGLQRGSLNPSAGLVEDSPSREGWFLISRSTLRRKRAHSTHPLNTALKNTPPSTQSFAMHALSAIQASLDRCEPPKTCSTSVFVLTQQCSCLLVVLPPPNVDVGCLKCNTWLCHSSAAVEGAFVMRGNPAYYFRELHANVTQGEYGTLLSNGRKYSGAIRWDPARCRGCVTELGVRRGVLHADAGLPEDVNREGCFLLPVTNLVFQHRVWWTIETHHQMLPGARAWIFRLMLIERRLAISADEDAADIASRCPLPLLPLEMWLHILLHVNSGSILPRS